VNVPDVIEEIGRRLGAVVPPPSRVVLFGSRSRGDADDGSTSTFW
jgi:predicted nucleotidyltransferase